MICPKCNVSNDEEYTFCVECGTPLPQVPDGSSEDLPTIQMSSDKLPETFLMPPDKLPETQLYSPPDSVENEAPPTVQMPPNELPPTIQDSNQQYVPSESVETAVSPSFMSENFKTDSDTNQTPKKSKKIFWIGGISLLVLLLAGGVATAYFLHQPGQKNRSYLLTDKHDAGKQRLQKKKLKVE